MASGAEKARAGRGLAARLTRAATAVVGAYGLYAAAVNPRGMGQTGVLMFTICLAGLAASLGRD